MWQSGRWLQSVAQAWLVLDLTGSALALGTITAVQFAPIILFSLFAGPLADRFQRHRFIMALLVASIIQTTALVVLVGSGHVQLWQIYVLAAVNGTLHAIDQPARSAFVSEIVPREQIQSAVGLNSTCQNSARILGPTIGGVLIATLGTTWCFAFNAVLYVIALLAYRAMRIDRIRPSALGAAGRLHAQIIDGLRYVAGDRELLVPLVLVGFIGTVGFNWSVGLALLARYTFEVGASGFGALNAAMGIGSLVGGIVVASRPPLGALGLSRVALAFSLLLMGVALAPTYEVDLAMLLLTGSVGVLFTAGVTTVVQLRSRPEYRGRVLGLLFLVMAGGTPIGGTFTGAVAAAWDVRVALALNAVICVAGAGVAIVYLQRRGPLTEVTP